ncbi:MAG: hypothetical protein RMJ19_01845, partial [Gemmatales bacterium]|nr:cadherin-like domain-containing protein [Gemmatales bacterium]MDW8174388.1 hypothetical protein [Gemmatales bacterium]
MNRDSSFLYRPEPLLVGLDSFTYWWSDGISSSSPVAVHVLVYDAMDLPAETEQLYIAVEELSSGLPSFSGQPWTVGLGRQPEWGNLSWLGNDLMRYQSKENLYEQVCSDWQGHMEVPRADSFSVWLTDSVSGVRVEREIVVGWNPFVSILNSISPPTQGDGSGQPVHEEANARNDWIARLRDH